MSSLVRNLTKRKSLNLCPSALLPSVNACCFCQRFRSLDITSSPFASPPHIPLGTCRVIVYTIRCSGIFQQHSNAFEFCLIASMVFVEEIFLESISWKSMKLKGIATVFKNTYRFRKDIRIVVQCYDNMKSAVLPVASRFAACLRICLSFARLWPRYFMKCTLHSLPRRSQNPF